MTQHVLSNIARIVLKLLNTADPYVVCTASKEIHFLYRFRGFVFLIEKVVTCTLYICKKQKTLKNCLLLLFWFSQQFWRCTLTFLNVNFKLIDVTSNFENRHTFSIIRWLKCRSGETFALVLRPSLFPKSVKCLQSIMRSLMMGSMTK